MTFSTKSNRERHLIRKHGVNMLDPMSRQTMDRPYKCPLCVFSSFSTQSKLASPTFIALINPLSWILLLNLIQFEYNGALCILGKLTCPCNTLRTSNSFARSDTGVVFDSKPHLIRTCKTSLLFAPLAVLFKLAVQLFCFTLRQNC